MEIRIYPDMSFVQEDDYQEDCISAEPDDYFIVETDLFKHKCATCKQVYPECTVVDLVFGYGPGFDNIIYCPDYKEED